MNINSMSMKSAFVVAMRIYTYIYKNYVYIYIQLSINVSCARRRKFLRDAWYSYVNKVILPRDEVFKQDSRIAVEEQLSKIMLPEAITCHFVHLLEIFKKFFLRARIFTLKLLSGSSLHRKRVFVVETCTAHGKKKWQQKKMKCSLARPGELALPV